MRTKVTIVSLGLFLFQLEGVKPNATYINSGGHEIAVSDQLLDSQQFPVFRVFKS